MTTDRTTDQPNSIEISTIRSLSLDVIHRMAAGEVIDSAAAVVRELVENAIDAKATRIVVYLWLEQWKIHVMDNGCGIDIENLTTIARQLFCQMKRGRKWRKWQNRGMEGQKGKKRQKSRGGGEVG